MKNYDAGRDKLQGVFVAMLSAIQRGGQWLFKAIFASHCVLCQKLVSADIALCRTCWGKMDFEIPLYLCSACGFPLPMTQGNTDWNKICLACMEQSSCYDGSAATLAYDEMARQLILQFKLHDALYLRGFLVYLLMLSYPRLPATDIIIPVPLHPLRLWRRRYNQSALLAWELGRLLGNRHQVKVGILQRVRYTKKQQGHPQKRMDNLKGAFQVAKKKSHLIKGKSILLVDDVLTSGATLEHCAKILKAAGARKVYGLAVARVVAPRPILKKMAGAKKKRAHRKHKGQTHA